MIPIDLKDCTFFVIDGTGTNFIAIRVGEGNFSYTRKRNIVAKKSRGNLDRTREGEQEPTDITFQFTWDQITSLEDETPTLEEAFDGTIPGWVSATADPDAPFSVNLQIVRSHTCQRPNATTYIDGETYNFPEFNVLSLAHSVKDSTVDCQGFSNRVKPTVTRP